MHRFKKCSISIDLHNSKISYLSHFNLQHEETVGLRKTFYWDSQRVHKQLNLPVFGTNRNRLASSHLADEYSKQFQIVLLSYWFSFCMQFFIFVLTWIVTGCVSLRIVKEISERSSDFQSHNLLENVYKKSKWIAFRRD